MVQKTGLTICSCRANLFSPDGEPAEVTILREAETHHFIDDLPIATGQSPLRDRKSGQATQWPGSKDLAEELRWFRTNRGKRHTACLPSGPVDITPNRTLEVNQMSTATFPETTRTTKKTSPKVRARRIHESKGRNGTSRTADSERMRVDPAQRERLLRARRAAAQRKAQAARAAQAAAAQSATHQLDDELWHFSIEKFFVYCSYAASIGFVSVFGLDLLTGIPFQRASVLYDATNVIGGITLAYLSWNCHRDLK